MLAASFAVSRVLYYLLGVRFDAAPLGFYRQYIDPELLRVAFWQSLFYLKEQPPGYNFYLGSILHVFPRHSESAFHVAHLVLGLATSWALFAVLDRMGANRKIALIVAIAFVVSPVTVLYENWLFYAYPVTALLCIGALFLHRYASTGRFVDASVCFLCLTLLGTMRTVYHPAWFGLIVFVVLWMLPRWRLNTAAAVAIPAVILGSIYVKQLVLFGGVVPGSEVFQARNLALMTVSDLPSSALRDLEASGKISRVLTISVWKSAVEFSDLVPAPPTTGIAILDNPLKSTGAASWHCLWMGRVGALCRKDALAVLRSYPQGYLRALRRNVGQYFLPADRGWPFDGTTHPNLAKLAVPLGAYDLLTTGTSSPNRRPWLSYVSLPGLLAFGLYEIARRARAATGDRPGALDPTGMTLLFVVFNITYVSAVTVVFSAGDHNRYRDEVSGCFAVLLGLLLTAGLRTVTRRGRRREPTACGL